MNKRLLIVPAVCLLVAAVCVWLWRLASRPPRADTTRVRIDASVSPADNGPTPKPAVPSPMRASLPDGDMPADLAGMEQAMSGRFTPDQLQPYLEESRRSAESLLAASRITGDLGLLRAAAQMYPRDPRVQFELAMHGATPEERRAALDALQEAAPDNAFGDYLAALEQFNSGNLEAALEELRQAAGKPVMDDYAVDGIQNAEEAYLSLGLAPAAAKGAAQIKYSLKHISDLRVLSGKMVEALQASQRAGDSDTANTIARMGVHLGQQTQTQVGQQFLLSDLIGAAVERQFLADMDPNTILDSSGITVADRLLALEQKRSQFKLVQALDPAQISSVSDRELSSYFERVKIYGEQEALRWFNARRSGR